MVFYFKTCSNVLVATSKIIFMYFYKYFILIE